MGGKSRIPEGKRARDHDPLAPIPLGEAVSDLLKVKKPGGKTKPKKAQSRERKKRNVDPRA